MTIDVLDIVSESALEDVREAAYAASPCGMPEEAEFVAAAMKVSGWSEEYAREVWRLANQPVTAEDERAIADVLDGIVIPSAPCSASSSTPSSPSRS